jgi:hypothetical protein
VADNPKANYSKYRWLARLRSLFGGGKKKGDDFDWGVYTHHYREELREIGGEHLLVIKPGDYAYRDGTLEKVNATTPPLHPNHRLVYETVMRLAPASACEFGCGGGDHLANLQFLAPSMKLFGFDISEHQLALTRERHPSLSAELKQRNIALRDGEPDEGGHPAAALVPVDLSYSQAVLMHIQTGDAHVRALENMFRAAGKHVVLMENWTRHPFVEDIRGLHAAGRIGWPTLHFHYRESPEYGVPHLMIVSRELLADYPVLKDYRALRDNVPKK